MHYFYFILIFFNPFYLPAQSVLTIAQRGVQTDSFPEFFVGNFEDSCLIRVNDSTLRFNYYLSEPHYVWVIIDDKVRPRWISAVWMDPEVKQKKLIIDYFHRTTMLDQNTWDALTDKWLKLVNENKLNEAEEFASVFIEKNFSSYLSLWFLSQRGAWLDNSKRLTLFNKLDLPLYSKSLYSDTKASFSERKYPAIGDSFKEFSLSNIKDSIFNTESIKNKWILLDFWSNGCAPCVKGMDAFVNLYNSLDTSRIAFISVSLDQNRNAWKNSRTSQKIKWANVWQPDNFYGELCLNYNVTAMPFFIIFNREKKIHMITFGDELELIKETLQSID